MTRLADTRGSMLIELLVATTMMLVVITATLNAFDAFGTNAKRNEHLSDAVDNARAAMDAIAKQARNATAYQTTSSTTSASILRADPTDLVFKVVDPGTSPSAGNAYSVQSIRYCLDATNRRLWRQRKADAVVPSTTCPDASWSTKDILATDVVNGTRPVFGYDQSSLATITSIDMHLYVDTNPGKAPVESALNSGVFLRNQNRRPIASFTAIPGVGGHVQLNGSGSSDPEGGLLSYQWKDGATVIPLSGPVVDYVAPGLGSHTFTLTVTDAGSLDDTTSQTVSVT